MDIESHDSLFSSILQSELQLRWKYDVSESVDRSKLWSGYLPVDLTRVGKAAHVRYVNVLSTAAMSRCPLMAWNRLRPPCPDYTIVPTIS